MRRIAALSGTLLVMHACSNAYGACPVEGPIDAHLAAGRVVFTGEVIEISDNHSPRFEDFVIFAVLEDFTKRLPDRVAMYINRRNFRGIDLRQVHTVVATRRSDGSLEQYCR